MTSQPNQCDARGSSLARPTAAAAAFFLALAIGVSGCSQQLSAAPPAPGQTSTSPPAMAVHTSTTLARIEQLIGSANCESDSQCQVAGIGERPCGGAESYRAWSTAATTTRALDEPLRAYAQERLRANEQAGVMSTCEIRPAPTARCERVGSSPQPGRCVLVVSSSGLR